MASRQDRFNWNEGDIELYDPQGRRVDPKTLKPIDPYKTVTKGKIARKKKKDG